jgi:hypothetical protein
VGLLRRRLDEELRRPGDLGESYLWQKVLPDGLHCYGSDVMPFDRPLDPGDRALLEEWILAGAPG